MMDSTDKYAAMRAEGICLGYDGGRKDTAIAATVDNRRHRERMGERGE